MPSGYRVSLVDGSLDPTDAITDPLITFNTDTVLGAGQWTWSGTFGGTTYTNEVEPGVYVLGTDGYVYFIPDFGPVDTITSASVLTAPLYDAAIYGTAGDDAAITGTAGDDLIYGGATRDPLVTGNDTITALEGDDQVFAGDGADVVDGGAGDDTLVGGLGNDTIDGGFGADSIEGGDGDDVLNGGGGGTPVASTREALQWSLAGADEASIAAGFSQDTGTMTATFIYRDDGGGTSATVESSTTQFTGGGEFSATSALELGGTGLGPTSTVFIDFAANSGTNLTDEVENVTFRINDVDTGGWQDRLTVRAFDADGNEVTVTLTGNGNDTVAGNVVTAGPGNDTAGSALGSILVDIAGPVQRIEVSYENLNTAGQIVFLTDIYFDTIPATEGADTLFGGTGDDIIYLGSFDTGYGEDGDDIFLIDATQLDGGAITVVGGEGNETAGDTLDLTDVLVKGSVVYTNTDDAAGGLSGTATLIDGSTVTFSQIESIICYTEGTLIQTPCGERRIETLKVGDEVVTLDDGVQPIRWIGRRTVAATGHLTPIRFLKGAVGNHTDLLVSPQHRMLCRGYSAQLLFGEDEVLAPAKSLVDDFNVMTAFGGMVTYIHMLFDRHQIVLANGAPSESFFPASQGLGSLEEPARAEVFELFPELREGLGSYGPARRRCLKVTEGRLLASA